MCFPTQSGWCPCCQSLLKSLLFLESASVSDASSLMTDDRNPHAKSRAARRGEDSGLRDVPYQSEISISFQPEPESDKIPIPQPSAQLSRVMSQQKGKQVAMFWNIPRLERVWLTSAPIPPHRRLVWNLRGPRHPIPRQQGGERL